MSSSFLSNSLSLNKLNIDGDTDSVRIGGKTLTQLLENAEEGPRGPRGPQGPEGPQGPQGPESLKLEQIVTLNDGVRLDLSNTDIFSNENKCTVDPNGDNCWFFRANNVPGEKINLYFYLRDGVPNIPGLPDYPNYTLNEFNKFYTYAKVLLGYIFIQIILEDFTTITLEYDDKTTYNTDKIIYYFDKNSDNKPLSELPSRQFNQIRVGGTLIPKTELYNVHGDKKIYLISLHTDTTTDTTCNLYNFVYSVNKNVLSEITNLKPEYTINFKLVSDNFFTSTLIKNYTNYTTNIKNETPGQIIYDENTNVLKVYNGTTWKNIQVS
jgi:hypothetical protein